MNARRSCRLLIVLSMAITGPPAVAAEAGDTLRVTLDECIASALETGEEMRLAEADRITAHALYVQARATAFPQLSASGSYRKQIESVFGDVGDSGIEAFDPDTTASIEERVRDLEKALPSSGFYAIGALFSSSSFASEHTWTGSLALSQRLFQGGSIWNSIGAARHALAAADLNRADRREEVVLSVRTGYLAALLAERQVRIAELSLEQADTQLRRVQLRQEAGQASEFELLQAQVERDNQLPTVKAAEAARTSAFLDLARICNLPATRPLGLATRLLDEAVVPAQPALPDTSGLVEAALESAGIRGLEEALEARGHAVGAAKADAWPDVSLFANVTQQAYPGDVFPQSDDWRKDISAGAQFTWNIFDGFRRSGSIEQARANQSATRQSLLQAREVVRAAVINYRWELERSALEIAARSRTVGFARRAHELSTLRREEGAASALEVNDSRIAFQRAQLSEAQARFDYFLALARLERLSGRPLFTAAAEAAGASRTDER